MKSNSQKALISVFVVAAFCLSSCGLIPKQRQESRPEERYVPVNARSDQNLRQRVVVLPFLDEVPERSMKVTENSRAVFVRQLASTGRFVLIPPEDLSKDVSKWVKDGAYDMEEVAKLATAADVSAVIEGSVLDLKVRKIGDEVGIFRNVTAQVTANVRIRVISSANAKELFSDVREAKVEATTRQTGQYEYGSKSLESDPRLIQSAVDKALVGALGGIVRSIDKIQWEGRIALIRGDRLYVNAGRLSGIQIGDILRVSALGEEVYDPESGVFIGRAPGLGKGTIEVVSYFGKDGAVAIIHSGGGFEQNDKVELY